jgi:hypothetical protein
VTKNLQPDSDPRAARRLLRGLALAPLLVVATTAPAFAEPPEAWERPDNPSTLESLLLLLGVPLLLFVIIATLVMVPSLVGGQRQSREVAFRESPEWFGGPRKGVEAAPGKPAEDEDRGGASARW